LYSISPSGGADTDGWALYHNGDVHGSADGGVLPPGADMSGFDTESGLGSITVYIGSGAQGSHSVFLFLDHDVDLDTSSYYNEYGLSHGPLPEGLSWEMDEPGYVHGDIYDNFLAGSLDNMNGIGPGRTDDMSMALGWDFDTGEARGALVTFYVTRDPFLASGYQGFCLSQTDAESLETLYLYSSVHFSEAVPVPEPGSIFLLIAGGALLRVMGRRSFA
jgi:hypothetical protein